LCIESISPKAVDLEKSANAVFFAENGANSQNSVLHH